MARFRFRLQPVLRQRELAERDERLAVAEIERERLTLEERLRAAQRGIEEEQRELSAIVGASGMNPAHARAQSASILRVRVQADRLARELTLVYRRLERARAELAQAAMKRRSMELLRDRKQEEFRRDENRNEDGMLDELAVMRAARTGGGKE